MGKQSDHKLIADLPLVFVATFLVAIAPLLLVVSLRGSGAVTSAWAGTAIGVTVSLVASVAGSMYWKTRSKSRDILFSDLMLWGWVQRWRSERRLTAAADLLGLSAGRPRALSGGRLTSEQKAGLLTQLTSGLEARDPYTHGHSRRVARLAASIAKRMGLSRAEVAKIRAAGAMHDVGKAKTPVAVLNKEGGLSDGEYAIIKRHPADGAEMVSTLRDDELTAMVRHHHERLDGTGYPDGLTGDEIPIGARILAVADTFDAITSTRPYRRAHAHKRALDILAAGAGTQLDPDAVRAFRGYYSGRRPLAFWMLLAYGRPRLATVVGGGLGPVNAATTVGNVMATAAAAAVVGGVALGSFVAVPVSASGARASARTADVATTTPRSSPKAAVPAPSGKGTTALARILYSGPRRESKKAARPARPRRPAWASRPKRADRPAKVARPGTTGRRVKAGASLAARGPATTKATATTPRQKKAPESVATPVPATAPPPVGTTGASQAGNPTGATDETKCKDDGNKGDRKDRKRKNGDKQDAGRGTEECARSTPKRDKDEAEASDDKQSLGHSAPNKNGDRGQ